jgi:capsular exopolysaccharide synthesis family protein
VDADYHTPKQHHIFKKNRWQKGLSSVVAGQAKLEDAIEPTGVEGLDLLACGPQAFSPSEMFNQERFRRLLATLAGRYDRVLGDSPPVLLFSDAQILAAQCDGIILVLRAGTSTRGDSIQAHAELTAVGARILGVVVNAVPHRRGSHRENGSYRCSREDHECPSGWGQRPSLPLSLLLARGNSPFAEMGSIALPAYLEGALRGGVEAAVGRVSL